MRGLGAPLTEIRKSEGGRTCSERRTGFYFGGVDPDASQQPLSFQ